MLGTTEAMNEPVVDNDDGDFWLQVSQCSTTTSMIMEAYLPSSFFLDANSFRCGGDAWYVSDFVLSQPPFTPPQLAPCLDSYVPPSAIVDTRSSPYTGFGVFTQVC